MFLPAIIGALYVAGAITATVAAVLTIASTIVSTSHSMRESRRARLRAQESARHAYNASLRDRTVMVRAEVMPANLIVGRCLVGGIMTWASSYGSKKENYRMTVAFSRHPVDAVESVFFGEEGITIDGSGYVQQAPYLQNRTDNTAVQSVTVPGSPYQVALTYTPNAAIWVQDVSGSAVVSGEPPVTLATPADYTVSGTTVTFAATHAGKAMLISYTHTTGLSWCNLRVYNGAQVAADSGLVSEIPSEWTASHIGYGIAYAVFSAAYNEDAFAQGLRDVRFLVRGAKVYDPRKDSTVPGGSGSHRSNNEATWEWSNNSALVAAWYLTHEFGVKVPWAKVNLAALIAAANVCDEDVQISATPTYQKRYTCDGTIPTGASKRANLQMICDTMAGEAFKSAGQWHIRAGAYSAPAVTIDESWLADGPVEVLPMASDKEIANSAIGTFANAADAYRENQIPEWSGAAYVTEDNGEKIQLQLRLPLTTDSVRAQRMLKIAVVDSRESFTVRLRANLRAYKLQPGDMVALTIGVLGVSAKPMRVKERAWTPGGWIDLILREEPNGKYDWSLGEVTVMASAANSNLPKPFAVPQAPVISGITSGSTELLRSRDGTFVSRMRVAWDAPLDSNVISGGRVELQFQGGANRTADAWNDGGVLSGDARFGYCAPVIDGTDYWIRVRFVSAMNVASQWTYGRHVAQGKTAVPPNVSGLTVSVLAGGARKFVVTLSAAIPDADGIELRYVSGGSGTWGSMTRLRYVPYTAGKLVYEWESADPAGSGTWTFAAKVIDTQGQESAAAAFVNGAVLGREPVVYGLRPNLLANSDWTDDLGYGQAQYSDARALRGYDAANTGGWLFARNYGGGQLWNVGNGGMWLNRAGVTNSSSLAYPYSAPKISCVPGTWYEGHVRCNPHRCKAQFYMRFWNAAQTLYLDAAGVAELDVGAGQGTNNPYSIEAMPLLWLYGRAPAVANGDAWDAAFVQLIFLAVGNGNSDPYAFWQQAMLCSPGLIAGHSAATHTPWIDGNPSTVDGQIVETYSGDENGGASYSVASADSGTWYSGYNVLQFTPRVSGKVSVTVALNIERNTYSGTPLSPVWQMRTRMYRDGIDYQYGRDFNAWPAPNDPAGIPINGRLTMSDIFNATAGVIHTVAIQYTGWSSGGSVSAYVKNIRTTVESIRK